MAKTKAAEMGQVVQWLGLRKPVHYLERNEAGLPSNSTPEESRSTWIKRSIYSLFIKEENKGA